MKKIKTFTGILLIAMVLVVVSTGLSGVLAATDDTWTVVHGDGTTQYSDSEIDGITVTSGDTIKVCPKDDGDRYLAYAATPTVGNTERIKINGSDLAGNASTVAITITDQAEKFYPAVQNWNVKNWGNRPIHIVIEDGTSVPCTHDNKGLSLYPTTSYCTLTNSMDVYKNTSTSVGAFENISYEEIQNGIYLSRSQKSNYNINFFINNEYYYAHELYKMKIEDIRGDGVLRINNSGAGTYIYKPSVTGTSSSTATLSSRMFDQTCSPGGENSIADKVSGTGIEYKAVGADTWADANGGEIKVTDLNGYAVDFSLSGLAANTAYEACAYYIDKDNNKNYSGIVAFTTTKASSGKSHKSSKTATTTTETVIATTAVEKGAIPELKAGADGSVNITAADVKLLAENKKPVKVINGSNTALIPAEVFTGNPGVAVNVNIKPVSDNLLAAANTLLTGNKNTVIIGGTENTINISINAGGVAVNSFTNPLQISTTLPDDTLKLVKDINHLSFAKVDATGKLTYIGGKPDLKTGLLTANTDTTGNFIVVEKDDIKKLTLSIGNPAFELNGVTNTLDVPPTIIGDRTMAPLRVIAENLGADVKWDQKTKTVTVTLDGKTLTMQIGQEIEGYGTGPIIQGNRTLVPIRYITEMLGSNVLWIPDNKTAEFVK